MTKRPKPIVLTVLDGWGYRAETKGNAIALARKPTYDHLIQNFANTLIATSGPPVGLPDGQMGNSEVGHMNIGAGRVVRMDITKIDVLVANKSFGEVPLFKRAIERRRRTFTHRTSFCVAGDGEATSGGKSVRALFYGRTGHASA